MPRIQNEVDDPQRKLVYHMEFAELRGQWRGTKTAMKTLKRYVQLVCRLYGLAPILLKVESLDWTGGVYEWDRPNGLPSRIVLTPNCRNAVTLAHELAHYVTHVKFPKTKQDHGPRFVRVYAEVLHILRLMPLEGMKAICRKHGVKMARSAV